MVFKDIPIGDKFIKVDDKGIRHIFIKVIKWNSVVGPLNALSIPDANWYWFYDTEEVDYYRVLDGRRFIPG